MSRVVAEIVDSDGHIFEQDDDIRPYFGAKYGSSGPGRSYFFPDLDGWRRGGRDVHDDPASWLRFLDTAEISAAVIYPTAGLGFGFGRDAAWAVELSRAYNDFMADKYLKASPRLKPIAILPVQDPLAAAHELRRAVEELGLVGGLLPAAGLRHPYGDPAFEPLYREADALGTVLAIHGAPRRGVGVDFFDDPNQAFILAHPYSLMTQFTSMACEGVFARFPRMKVAFLEAGCGWVPYLIERIDRRMVARGNGPLASEQVRDCPIYFHAELEEKEVLPLAVSVVGDDRFLYATDFPHESAETASRALQSFLNRDDVSQSTKQKILCDNVKAMYGLK
ncbi:MAG: hypothetical protein EXR58_07230 [Chloroflexi bacterium]|nr:hypothetical protein [Chloroflexota bacterium]